MQQKTEHIFKQIKKVKKLMTEKTCNFKQFSSLAKQHILDYREYKSIMCSERRLNGVLIERLYVSGDI